MEVFMLQEERINAIRQQIITNKKVTISELCQKFKVSDVTIRKDLQVLSNEGLIKKMYGGALLNESFSPTASHMVSNTSNFSEDKKIVAQLAASQIEDGDTLFLGSGITCSLLAKELSAFKNLTIVTNNVSALNDLLAMPCKLFIIGGEVATVDKVTFFSSIENPSQYLQSIFVDKAFTSCSGLDLTAGITVNSIISTYIYKSMLQIKKRWYLMLDEEKFDHMGFYKVADLNQVDYLISNNIPDNYFSYLNNENIPVLLPDS